MIKTKVPRLLYAESKSGAAGVFGLVTPLRARSFRPLPTDNKKAPPVIAWAQEMLVNFCSGLTCSRTAGEMPANILMALPSVGETRCVRWAFAVFAFKIKTEETPANFKIGLRILQQKVRWVRLEGNFSDRDRRNLS